MTEKEKAKKLVERFTYKADPSDYTDPEDIAIWHSRICIDEKINENKSVLSMLETHGNERSRFAVSMRINELQQLKQEIEKL